MGKLMSIVFPAILAVLALLLLIDRGRQVEQMIEMRKESSDIRKATSDSVAVVSRIEGSQAKLDQLKGIQEQIAGLNRTAEKLGADLGQRAGESQAKLGELKTAIDQLGAQTQVLSKQQSELRAAIGDSAALARAIEQMNKDLATLQGSVGNLQGGLSGLQGSVGNLQGNLGTLQGNLNTLQGNVGALGRKVDEVSTRPVPVPRSEKPAIEPPKADPGRDGNVKLGVNFLLPVDRSTFDQKKAGGTFRNIGTTTKKLNPITDNSATTSAVHALCNDSLCDRRNDKPELWQESLAESLIISDDYKTYTFVIRKGVMWQRPPIARNPKYAWLDKDVELTADDFKFTMDLIMNPDVDCPSQRAYFEDDFDKIEVIDRYSLRVRWKNRVYQSLTSSMGLSPTPRHIYARNADGSEVPAAQLGVSFNKHWFDELFQVVGVGAYILETYEKDQKVEYRKNPSYWGVPLHFDRIATSLSIKKDDARLIAFKNGDIHTTSLSPNQYRSEILDHKEARFTALDPANPKAGRAGELGWERVGDKIFSYIGWNMRRPLFSDKRVRQAMSHAFDKPRIIRDVFYGLGQPVLSDVHPSMSYCNTDLKPYAYDLARAKALLEEAGWKDSDGDGVLDRKFPDGKRVQFKFEIKYIADRPEWDGTLLIYKNALKTLGIAVDLRPLEWKELMRVYEDKDFDAVVGGWQMGWDLDYFQLWHSKYVSEQGSSNHCGFANARVDELALKLRQTFEMPGRIAIAKEIQAILHDEQPYTFFRASESIFVWQNRSAPNVEPPRERFLDGVTRGLDEFHPLENRVRTYWHFRN